MSPLAGRLAGMQPTTRKLVEAVLRARCDSVGLEGPRMFPGDRSVIARQTHETVALPDFVEPRVFAQALGVRHCPGSAGACGGEMTDGKMVVYRYMKERQDRGLLFFHGISHAVLHRHGE